MVETAVVLLSGGMDSATALAMTIKEGHRVISLTFDYGQRHRNEINAAERIAKHFRVPDRRTMTIDLSAIGGSALTDPRIRVPEQRRPAASGRGVANPYDPAGDVSVFAYAGGLAGAIRARARVPGAGRAE